MSRGRERTGCPGSPAEGASSGHLAAAFGLAVGTAYQAVAAANVRRRHPPPDRVVGAGGHRLHLNVTGQDRGGPTVVLEAGGTSFSPQWARVQPGISRFARVISYDRARLGWSEPGSGPRKARSIAREFHMALGNAGIEGPYVPSVPP